jgi:hypothetical protein
MFVSVSKKEDGNQQMVSRVNKRNYFHQQVCLPQLEKTSEGLS